MNKKGFKTTIVAIIIGVLSVAVIVLWMMDHLDNIKLAIGLSSISGLGATIIGLLSKDATASHTHNGPIIQGTVDPTKPGGPKT